MRFVSASAWDLLISFLLVIVSLLRIQHLLIVVDHLLTLRPTQPTPPIEEVRPTPVGVVVQILGGRFQVPLGRSDVVPSRGPKKEGAILVPLDPFRFRFRDLIVHQLKNVKDTINHTWKTEG